MVAVDAVIIEVLSCNNASMRYIFKGEKPANLPAQARTKYQLATNLKTAKALGLTAPSSLLAPAYPAALTTSARRGKADIAAALAGARGL